MKGGGLALLAAAALAAGCGSYFRSERPEGVAIADDGAAVVWVAALRPIVFDAAVEEITRRGAVLVSSAEALWVKGESEGAQVAVNLEDEAGGTRMRVLVTNPPTTPEGHEMPQRIAGAIARRAGAATR
ncbi:MAG TPA: hypothetical protein VKE69_09925 [Planctomycetota bacterium]|nr:hypothetical protein [Planctomycetota bacterium]